MMHAFKIKVLWHSVIILWLNTLMPMASLVGQTYSTIPFGQFNIPAIEQRWLKDTGSINQLIKAGSMATTTNPDTALILLNDALLLSENVGFNEGSAKALINKGIVYYYTGAYDLSIAILEKALPYCELTTSYNEGLPSAYVNLGNAWSQKGNYVNAANYYNLALAQTEKYKGLEELTARIYTNYAGMFGELNEPEKAIFYLEKGEQVLRKSKLVKPLAILLYNKAAALIGVRKYDQADSTLKEALAIGRQLQDIETQKFCLNAISNIYLTRGKPETAMRFAEEAYRLRPTRDPNIETGILLTLAEVCMSTQRYKDAEQYLLQTLSLAKQHNMASSRVTMQAHNHLSTLYANTNNYEKAWAHNQQYMEIKDSLMSETRTRHITQMETRYRTAQKDKELTKKELLIYQQQLQMEKDQKWLWLSVSGAGLLAAISLLQYRNIRHKAHIEKEKHEVLKREQELKILKAAMNGEENERMRIGRELHDGVGGLLSALKINFSVIRMQNKALEQTEAFKNVFVLMDEATDEIRKTAHNLMPEMLLKGGITEAVKNFCERIPKTQSITLQVLTYGHPVALDPGFELSLYRIIQELINNVIRHAKASIALVQLGWQEHTLNITVEDDGIGFDWKNITHTPGNGIGLNNVKIRVEALEGQLDIESKKNAGTTIELEFALHKIKKVAV